MAGSPGDRGRSTAASIAKWCSRVAWPFVCSRWGTAKRAGFQTRDRSQSEPAASASQLFAADFNLNDWLDQQGVPPLYWE